MNRVPSLIPESFPSRLRLTQVPQFHGKVFSFQRVLCEVSTTRRRILAQWKLQTEVLQEPELVGLSLPSGCFSPHRTSSRGVISPVPSAFAPQSHQKIPRCFTGELLCMSRAFAPARSDRATRYSPTISVTVARKGVGGAGRSLPERRNDQVLSCRAPQTHTSSIEHSMSRSTAYAFCRCTELSGGLKPRAHPVERSSSRPGVSGDEVSQNSSLEGLKYVLDCSLVRRILQ